MLTKLLLSLVAVSALYGDSKSEAALKAQLDAAQASLVQAAKERATLAATLAKLNAEGATRSASAAAVSNLASANAQAAQTTAETNGSLAQKAATDASAAATAASVAAASAAAAAATAAATARSQNTALMITQVFGFLAVLSGFLFKAYTDARDRRWARKDAEDREKRSLDHRTLELAAIAEVGESAKQAYREANTVNNKLANIGVQMKDGQPLNDGSNA